MNREAARFLGIGIFIALMVLSNPGLHAALKIAECFFAALFITLALAQETNEGEGNDK